MYQVISIDALGARVETRHYTVDGCEREIKRRTLLGHRNIQTAEAEAPVIAPTVGTLRTKSTKRSRTHRRKLVEL